jgi:hypothetical protein
MFDHQEENLRRLGKYTVKQDNKYGFWTIYIDKGKLPTELAQKFTMAKLAGEAILAYNKKKAI